MPETKPEQGSDAATAAAPKSDSKSGAGGEGESKVEFEKKPKLSKQERRELQAKKDFCSSKFALNTLIYKLRSDLLHFQDIKSHGNPITISLFIIMLSSHI